MHITGYLMVPCLLHQMGLRHHRRQGMAWSLKNQPRRQQKSRLFLQNHRSPASLKNSLKGVRRTQKTSMVGSTCCNMLSKR